MILPTTSRLSRALLLGLLVAAPCVGVATEAGGGHQLYFSGAFVRTVPGEEWSIRITGRVPSLSGCYLLVHDAKGNVRHEQAIAQGDYEDNPLEIRIPKSERAEDLRCVIIGQQEDVMGVNLPLTTLAYEVYGGKHFGKRSADILYFRPEGPNAELAIWGSAGSVKVLKEGRLLLEAKPETAKRKSPVAFHFTPGELYQLDTSHTFYFGMSHVAYLAFEPGRLFQPDPALASAPWWQSPPHAANAEP